MLPLHQPVIRCCPISVAKLHSFWATSSWLCLISVLKSGTGTCGNDSVTAVAASSYRFWCTQKAAAHRNTALIEQRGKAQDVGVTSRGRNTTHEVRHQPAWQRHSGNRSRFMGLGGCDYWCASPSFRFLAFILHRFDRKQAYYVFASEIAASRPAAVSVKEYECESWSGNRAWQQVIISPRGIANSPDLCHCSYMTYAKVTLMRT